MNLIERIFHHRTETRPLPEAWRNNTEDYAEPFDAPPEAGDEILSAADPSTAAVTVHFFFVHGQPGSGGFLLQGRSTREVFVAGDFNGWNPADLPLEQRADGYWEADIVLPPGRHEYVFVTDGIWHPDPMAESVPNESGGVNSVVTVPVRSGT